MKNTDKLFDITKVDAFLIISEKNRFYFTEFASTFGYLVLLRNNRSVFVTDPRYYEMAQSLKQDGVEVVQVSGREESMLALRDVFESNNVKTVGFEDNELTVQDYLALKHRMLGVRLVASGDAINYVRSYKTDEEIAYIKKAQSITDAAFSAILDYLKPGISERDIQIELEYQMAKTGAAGLAFDTIIASGVNSSKPHAHPTDKIIELGDPITMDFGAKYHGYCSDMTRTVFVGQPSEELHKIYNIVLLAQKMGINNAYCGMGGRELDSFCREVIKSNGYEKYFVHSTGHSLGIDIHETPTASMGSTDKLTARQFITCEPGIYIPGVGGVRIEDLLLVEEDGITDLTTSDKNIIIL